MGKLLVLEGLELGSVGKLSEDKQEGDFEECGLLSKFLDWDSSVFQNPLVSIDVADIGGGADGVHISWVIDPERIPLGILNLEQILGPDKIVLS